MKAVFPVVLMILFACNDAQQKSMHEDRKIIIPSLTVDAEDKLLSLQNGVWFYRGRKFSGTMQAFYETGRIKSVQSFYEGREEGWMNSFYENGARDAHRYYHNGEKDGVNEGWWVNGNRRFEYHFRNGAYEGSFTEWYINGRTAKYIWYHQGKEQLGRGWRENGKSYMSFVVKDGRLYGQINPNLCYSLKRERGEFVANVYK